MNIREKRVFLIQYHIVRCLKRRKPAMPVHRIVKRLEGRSSNILRKEFPELLKLPSLWTHSYYVSTVGAVSKETVEKYIEAQKGV
ncbi:MAG: hypothetical protein HA490_00840 [Archaeoglobales archaeon]|nr:hypothetical protein [Archaeoglobales archaeon]